MKKVIILTLFIINVFQVLGQSPGPRDHLGMAYDISRNKIVLHSGNDTTSTGDYSWNATTWEWDSDGWQQVDEGKPGGMSSHSFVYYPARQSCISVGGVNDAFESVKNIWVWDGSEWQTQNGEGPGARLSSAMGYDPLRQEVILFSSCGGREYLTDTWVFNENGWSKKEATGPPGICRAAMFFDEVRKTMIVFGGALETHEKTNAMWEWDGNRWAQVDQGVEVPAPRSNIQMAYDSNRQRAVLFAGKGKDGILNDLWEWDGVRWRKISKQSNWPQNVEVYAIAYHQRLKKVFLYGGRIGRATPISDFWSWDGEIWEQIE